MARAHEGATWFDAGAWWQQARAGYPDVWVYVQASIGYADIGDPPGTGMADRRARAGVAHR
jgi:hypothetical protein